MSITPLLPQWRPNATGPSPKDRPDRELIRQYAEAPASEGALEAITEAMNMAALNSPDTVAQLQAWINEIQDLETDYADKVATGVAHLGNASEYEGLRPGASPTVDDVATKADVLEWDPAILFKVRTKSSGRPLETATGVTQDRIQQLKARVLEALGLSGIASGDGTFSLERS